MMDNRASSRYAKALLGIARERGQLEPINDELAKVRALLGKHPEITHLALNSTIALSEKEDFLGKIFGSEVSPLTINFLRLLVRKRRFGDFPEIQDNYRRQYEESQGIRQVTVLSRGDLPPQTKDRLNEALKKKLGAKVRLNCETDPAMIGGLILRFADKEIDASFRSRLQELTLKLLAL